MTVLHVYDDPSLDRAGHLRAAIHPGDLPLGAEIRLTLTWQGHSLFHRDRVEPVLLTGFSEGLHGLDWAFLGREGMEHWFAVDLGERAAEDALLLASRLSDLPVEEDGSDGAAEFVDLRRHGPVLPRPLAARLAYARGLAFWHQRHRFCGACGAPTVAEQAGHVRRCVNPDCGISHFPRTDPAMIVLITDGDRALLGRQAAWPAGMYSCLAGFVEPGESLEQAVRREVLEEAGITLSAVRYHSSQPWPFPASLMIGFRADAASTEIRIDPAELEDARWFTRQQVRTPWPDGTSVLSPRTDSIARHLIDAWLAEGD